MMLRPLQVKLQRAQSYSKYIKFNEMKNKIFLDALCKSNARWDGKQDFSIWPKNGDFFHRDSLFLYIFQKRV